MKSKKNRAKWKGFEDLYDQTFINDKNVVQFIMGEYEEAEENKTANNSCV